MIRRFYHALTGIDAMQADSDDDQTLAFRNLIEAARSGDQEAVNRLIEDCRPYLLMIANKEVDGGLAQKAGASDLVQDAMVSAHRCLGDFAGESREEWLSWLRAILINDVKQTRRRYRAQARDLARERPIDDDGDSANLAAPQIAGPTPTPSSAAIGREDSQRMRECLAQMSSEDQQVLELRIMQQLPLGEVGERMGRSSEAVRKLCNRAVRRLKKIMRDDE